MGTRAVIARKTTSGFGGVYHHWDGYPSGLGATLHEIFNGHFKRDMGAMLAYLIDEHPAGWSTINGADFNAEPGFDENGFKSAGPKCYCHGGRKEEANPLNETNSSGCGCEWAYVFSEQDGKPIMEIFSSYHPTGGKMIGFFGCGNPDSKWYGVGRVVLSEAAPDWEKIEQFEPVQPVLN